MAYTTYITRNGPKGRVRTKKASKTMATTTRSPAQKRAVNKRKAIAKGMKLGMSKTAAEQAWTDGRLMVSGKMRPKRSKATTAAKNLRAGKKTPAQKKARAGKRGDSTKKKTAKKKTAKKKTAKKATKKVAKKRTSKKKTSKKQGKAFTVVLKPKTIAMKKAMDAGATRDQALKLWEEGKLAVPKPKRVTRHRTQSGLSRGKTRAKTCKGKTRPMRAQARRVQEGEAGNSGRPLAFKRWCRNFANLDIAESDLDDY